LWALEWAWCGHVHIYDFLKFLGGLWALEWAWQTFFYSKYSFTLRVTGITRKKAIGEYLDYQIPVSQLNPKGNGDMQAARRNKMRHLPAVYRYKALWALEWAWQLFLKTFFYGR